MIGIMQAISANRYSYLKIPAVGICICNSNSHLKIWILLLRNSPGWESHNRDDLYWRLLPWLIVCVVIQQANAASQCYQQQQQHIHLSQPNINIACRGRSLPNVNQMSSSSGIDLQVLYNVHCMMWHKKPKRHTWKAATAFKGLLIEIRHTFRHYSRPMPTLSSEPLNAVVTFFDAPQIWLHAYYCKQQH